MVDRAFTVLLLGSESIHFLGKAENSPRKRIYIKNIICFKNIFYRKAVAIAPDTGEVQAFMQALKLHYPQLNYTLYQVYLDFGTLHKMYTVQ